MSFSQSILVKYRATSRTERKKGSNFEELIRINAWCENAINLLHSSNALYN